MRTCTEGETAREAGFILLESLLALFTFAVAFLVLEGCWSLLARSLADARRESVATALAVTRREGSIALGCVPGSGTDSLEGIAVRWESVLEPGALRLSQTWSLNGRYGIQLRSYESRSRCPR